MTAGNLKFTEFNGFQDYESIFEKMRCWALEHQTAQSDEVWFLEHSPVFTQGQAGKDHHILNPHNIPVVKSDRGGQVTYHGPGQLMIYVLWDIKRMGIGVRQLVTTLESIIIELLQCYDIAAHRLDNAPGIYVNHCKIASLGLRIKRGCSYHGISLNVDMDLTPFQYINPCGFKNLEMTQIKKFTKSVSIDLVKQQLKDILVSYHSNHYKFLPHLEKSAY